MDRDYYTDRAALRERFYAGPDKLAARQRLWDGGTGESFVVAALDLAELAGDEVILDAGCENGAGQLETAFADVRRIELTKAVPVTKEVVVDYIASAEPENCGVEAGAQHEAFMNEVRATARLTQVTSAAGLFIGK